MRPSQLVRKMRSGSVRCDCSIGNAQGEPVARRDQLQGSHISLQERCAVAACGADDIDEMGRDGLPLDVISFRAAISACEKDE
eukprot:11781025-Karenia_brevis.AAC.1